MPLEAPFWWYRKKGVLASALAPIGAFYGRIAASRVEHGDSYRSRLPVICIGNFTAGGGGKTPTAIAVAMLLKGHGKRPAFLTRGYGGKAGGVTPVTESASAENVGDEPLLLASVAPTFVSADRVAGAKAIEETDADIIVMDDGFQNPSLAKDVSLVVVDAGAGLGNGLVIPAGPLRAPLDAQLPRADALCVIGEGKKAASLIETFETRGKPVLNAKIAPNCDPRWLTVLPVIGFAGIARPVKFFTTLKSNGARLIGSHAFPDHHRFTARQAARLLKEAEEKNAMLVTTEKDWARLPDDDEEDPRAELKHRSRPFPIVVTFDDEAVVKALLSSITHKDA
jgi:tetraacyldisaccharide 4'-kinase